MTSEERHPNQTKIALSTFRCRENLRNFPFRSVPGASVPGMAKPSVREKCTPLCRLFSAFFHWKRQNIGLLWAKPPMFRCKSSDVCARNVRCFVPSEGPFLGFLPCFSLTLPCFPLSSSGISPPRSQPSSPNSAAVRCLFLSFGVGSPPGICRQVLRWTLLFVSESCGFYSRKDYADIAAFVPKVAL